MAMTKEWKRKLEYYLTAIPHLFLERKGALTFEGFITKERLTLAQAQAAPRQPMPEGSVRGDKWEYAWLFTKVTVPEDCAGKRLVIKSQNGEGIVWINGQIVGAFDQKHHEITLTACAEAGQVFEIAQEAYAGHGATQMAYGAAMEEENRTADWTKHEYSVEGYPQTVKNGEWGVWDEELFQIWIDLSVLSELADALDQYNQRRVTIERDLVKAISLIDLTLPPEARRDSLRAADGILKPLLACKNTENVAEYYAFGHSHLDLEWLWTNAETRRKIARTVGNQLQLLKEYPTYRYLQSQPWLMDVLKKEYPDLYAEFKAAVQAGRIIVEGGSWVEPDVNIPWGESLVRQYLYGKRFLKEEFGVDSKLMWLPDSFGCGATLPQILKGCGIDYFCSCKLAWVYNDGEIFPFNDFRWQGIDGSSVLATITPGYTANPRPVAMRKLWERPTNFSIENAMRAYPMGYGDGGGGATREQLEFAVREADLEGIPKIQMHAPIDYFKRMEALDIKACYSGELYYTAHRGTYTSQAKTKQLHRQAELALRNAEWTDALLGQDDRAAYEAQWKTLLFNEFHDILPGSSLTEVHEKAEKSLAEVIHWATLRTAQALKQAVQPTEKTLTLLNTLSWNRQALLPLPQGASGAKNAEGQALPTQTLGDETYALVDLPACGTASLTLTEESAFETQSAQGLCLENDRIRAQFNQRGELISVVDLESGLEQLKGKGNEFKLFKDMPLFCEAWDIDSHYDTQEVALTESAEFGPLYRGPLFSRVAITRKINQSVVRQTVTLRQGTKQLDFATEIDWQETQKMLKVYFDSNLNTTELRSETQFGYINRPAHRSTLYARDRFEVCQHKWSALVENKRVFALLNDCKYGIGALGGQMGLTLLKSSMAPAKDTDKGLQTFTYSLLLAEGMTEVIRAAWELNLPTPTAEGWREGDSIFTLSCDNVLLDTVKKAEDDENALIVRLYEATNALTACTLHTTLPVKKAYLTNLLEQEPQEVPVEQGDVRLTLRGFQIATLKLEF